MAQRIGRYEIQDEVGQGAFGRVYRALDPSIPRLVALKVLTFQADQEILTRFRNEAAAAGNLDHKNIVRIYEYAEHKGNPYIAMEFLEGEDLQHLMASRKPLSLLKKMGIMAQVAEGLSCAHEHGIVHRDVKPANIMILDSRTESRTVKIMDFGIARLNNANSLRLTRAGTFMGTPFYMSPEGHNGEEGDVLGDVWAYGVVYYELLTGRKPFKAENDAELKRKITREEPPPIRALVPDCPETLEQIVLGALRKERELRYQTLRDMLDDLAPILIQLQKGRAGELLLDAQRRFENAEFDAAQALLREILDLDPGNSGATQLRKEIQNKRVLAPRVTALVERAEQDFNKGDFEGAIKKFEIALSLDRNNTLIKSRVEHARTAFERSKRAGRLLARARQELQRQNLTGAYSNALEALEADPANSEAATLREQLATEIQARTRDRRITEVLRQAEGHRMRGDFDAALSVISAAEPELLDSPQIAEVLNQLRTDRARENVRRRVERFESEMAEARDLVRRQRFAEGIAFIEQICHEFPEEKTAADLLSDAREGLLAQQRAESIAKLCKEARALITAGRYVEARGALGEGLRIYPRDAGLQHLLDGVSAAERDQTITDTITAVRDLRRTGELEKAIEAIGSALQVVGNDAALTNLQRQLAFELEQQRYSDGLRIALDEGQRLLADNHPAEAVAFLEKAARTYSIEPELNFLLNRARQAQVAEEDRLFIRDALAEAESFERALDFQSALRKLEQALRRCPSDPELRSAAARARDLWQREERKNAIAREIAEIRKLLAAGDWSRAEEAAAITQDRFPEEIVFEELRNEASGQLKLAAKKRLAAEIRALGDRYDFVEAFERLSSAEQAYGADPLWQTLRSELERKNSYSKSIATAESFRSQGEYDKAEEYLRAEIAKGAPDDRASALLAGILGERAKQGREQLIRDATHLIATKHFSRALEMLDPLVREHPADEAVRRARQLAAEGLDWEREQLRREQIIRESVERSRELERTGQYVEALRSIERSLGRYPGDKQLTSRASELQEALFRIEQNRKLGSFNDQIQRALNSGDWTTAEDYLREAVQAFPDEPRWSRLGSEIREGRRRTELESVNTNVRDRLAHNDLEGATRLLTATRGALSTEPLWQALNQETEDRSTYQKQLRAAQQLRTQGEYVRAEQLLDDLIRAGAHDGEAAALLNSIRSEHAEKARKRKCEVGLARAGELAASGDLPGASRVLEMVRKEFPTDDSVTQAIESLARGGKSEPIRLKPSESGTVTTEAPPEDAPSPLKGSGASGNHRYRRVLILSAIAVIGIALIGIGIRFKWPADAKPGTPQDLRKAAQDKGDREANIRANNEAKDKVDQEAIKAAQEAKIKADQDAKIKADREAKIKADQDAKIKADREAKIKADQDAKIKADREAKIKADQDAKIKADREAKIKADQDAKIKADREAKIKADQERTAGEASRKQQLEAQERDKRRKWADAMKGEIDCHFGEKNEVTVEGLPGVEVNISGNNIVVVDPPSWKNDWRKVTVKRTDPALSDVVLHWKIKPQVN